MKLSIKQGPNYKWLVFVTVGLGTFMAVVDHGSVNVALPTIATYFKADLPTVQWVALGYSLAISALLLPTGRLADVFGRKEVYILGFVLLGLTSAMAGAAPNLWTLIGFKTLSAIGSSMIMANGTAILVSAFHPSERGKAVGSHMTAVGTGSIFGPVLGGLLVEGLGWRSVFFINLPIAALGVATALVILDSKQLSQARANGERSSFDWAGAGLSAGALVTFLMAVTNGHRWGWGSPAVVGGFMGAGALLALFLWRETCTSSPMLDLDLFKRRVFSLGALAAFTAFLSTASIFFLMPFYLQKILGYSPGQAGLILVASSACMATTGPIAGRLSDRFGWRVFTVGGAAVSAVSMFLVSQLSEDSTLALVVPALILHGVGGGMFHAANHSSVLGAVEPSRYGVASAFIHLNRNTASTTGLAIAIAIVVTTMGSMGFEPSLDAVTGGAGGGVAHAFTVGLRRVYYMTGGILIAVMIMSLFQGKRTRVLPEAKAGVPQVANGVKEAARGTPD